MSELFYTSATRLAGMIRSGDVSSAEVVEAHIERIEAVNPTVNAVAQLLASAAQTAAKKADKAKSNGDVLGPLHGVPVTVKDAIQIGGVISTGGTLGRKSYVATDDSEVVARLRAAGAIPLANTNVPELCLAGETASIAYGTTNNPYDAARTPGGSSGGEAALIASGGSPLGLGSDVGGSIRQPAHFCGIAGLKPTTGRVPSTGHWVPLIGLLGPMFSIGPMARFVEDLELALPILCGPDGRDPYAAPVPLGTPCEVDLSSLRVASFTHNGSHAADADTATAIAAATKALKSAGVSVDDARPPGFERASGLFMAALSADAGAGVRALLAGAGTGTGETHPYMDDVLALMGDTPLSASDFAGLLADLDVFKAEMLAFMQGYDALLCPTTVSAAVPHGTFIGDQWPGVATTFQFNLTGWPAAVVRAGQSGDLPIGVQIAARPWREDVALALAGQIESASGGWQAPGF
jgi:amidase